MIVNRNHKNNETHGVDIMNYKQAQDKLNEDKFSHKCILIKGNSASGKTTLATTKYRNLIENENIKSSNILCLFMNKYQNITWTKDMIFNTAGEIRKSSDRKSVV